MVALEVQPLILKNVLLTIDALDYRKHVSQVEFAPATSKMTWTGLGGNTHTDQSTATWDATLKYVQDWTSSESLSQFLYENEGEIVPCTFRPSDGVGPTFTADLVVTPGAIGGTVNTFAETSVTLGCNGRPVLVPAV